MIGPRILAAMLSGADTLSFGGRSGLVGTPDQQAISWCAYLSPGAVRENSSKTVWMGMAKPIPCVFCKIMVFTP